MPSLMWTARKIVSQDLGYLPRRSWYVLRRRYVDRVFPNATMAARMRLAPAAGRDESLRRRLVEEPTVRWHWPLAEAGRAARSVPRTRRDTTVRAADEVLARRFTFRSEGPLSLAPGTWESPTLNRAWTWDLNRHHWFATLGFAFAYTGDRRYADAFVRESGDWIERFIGRIGRIGWDTPFEVAGRINAWLWAWALFAGWEDWDPGHHDRFVGAIGTLAEYLHQSIEFHSPGNHILLEAKALTLVGRVFPEFAGAASWRRKGWRILARELRHQICRDGVHAERSTMYHRIVAGELSELWHLCRRREQRDEAEELAPTVTRMAEFQRWIRSGDGDYPLFGDAHAEDTYYRFSAPAVSAAMRDRPFHELIDEVSDYSWWLLADVATVAQADAPTLRSRAFPAGGYYISRSGWSRDADVLVWDCGETGYSRNRKHAHLDALSFTLAVSGVPLLIDPGTDQSDEHKELLRSSRAHSTLVVDTAEQGVPAERGEIWQAPEPRLLVWGADESCTVMAGSHGGYLRLEEPVRHTRTIVAMHGLYWLVLDWLDGSGVHHAEQRFHFAPGTELRAAGALTIAALREGAALTVHALGDSVPSYRDQASGGSDQIRAALEDANAQLHCGHRETTQILCFERSGPVPFSLGALLVPGGQSIEGTRIARTPDLDAFTVKGAGFEDLLCFARGRPGIRQLLGGWETDAAVAIMRRRSGGRDVLVTGGSVFRRESHDLIRDQRPAFTAGALTRLTLPELVPPR